MSKETTLDDIAKQLAHNNKVQKETNENLGKLIDLFKKQMESDKVESQREKSNRRSEEKFKRRTGDEGGSLVALAHGDLLKALLGVPGMLLTFAGLGAAIVKFSQTVQEFFDPFNQELHERSQWLRKQLVAGAGISKTLIAFFGSFTVLGKTISSVAMRIPVLNRVLMSLSRNVFGPAISLISRGDVLLQRMFRLSFGNMFGFLKSISKIFTSIFKWDIIIRSAFTAFNKFKEETGDVPRRLFSALIHGVTEGLRLLFISIIDAFPLIFKAVNFIFDDMLGWVDRTGIPVVSHLAGAVRNTFMWFRDFAQSNEKLNEWLGGISKYWSEKGKEQFNEMFTVLIPGMIVGLFDAVRYWLGLLEKSSAMEIVKAGETLFNDVMSAISNLFKATTEAIEGVLKGVGDWVQRKTGFKAPERWPWQRDKAEPPRMSKRERQRVEEIEREAEEKRRAEVAANAASNVIVTDASTNTSTTTAVNTQQMLPAPPATDRNDPAYGPVY